MIQLGVEGMWIEVLIITGLLVVTIFMIRSVDKDNRDNPWGDDL